jgi:hypothetical protein
MHVFLRGTEKSTVHILSQRWGNFLVEGLNESYMDLGELERSYTMQMWK